MTRGLTATTLGLVLAASACSGASEPNTPDTAGGVATVSTTTQATPEATLTIAARAAILAHHELSVRVLWTNNVPKRQTVVAGPALANLRTAAAARRERGIRVRLLSERFRITSLQLDPSYASATAVVSDPQRVRPYSDNGEPLGKSIRLDEKARIELRRAGSSPRFLVWKVTPIR